MFKKITDYYKNQDTGKVIQKRVASHMMKGIVLLIIFMFSLSMLGFGLSPIIYLVILSPVFVVAFFVSLAIYLNSK